MLLNDRGNVAFMFAVLAPVLLATAGGAIDFQRWNAQTAALQNASDNLATRGAREYLLNNISAQEIESLVKATARTQYEPVLGEFSIAVAADSKEKSVTVELSQPAFKGFFLDQLKPLSDGVRTEATAIAKGTTNVCVIALEPKDDEAIFGDDAAVLSAPDCAVMSNSVNKGGISLKKLAKISARLICSAGGVKGSASRFDPQALTDCPVYDDPLMDRAPPAVGPCDQSKLDFGIDEYRTAEEKIKFSDLSVANPSTLPGYRRYDLEPGVYCDGVHIRAGADVHLAPGIYIIKDGDLEVDLGGRLYGENVGFYLSGENSIFAFKKESNIHLTAPRTGLMAGLLFFEDRQASIGRKHKILSENARTLLGTFYLSRGYLEIESPVPLADHSAYTAMVVRRLKLSGAPTLVLNADYSQTDIPVPEGIGPTGGQVMLRN